MNFSDVFIDKYLKLLSNNRMEIQEYSSTTIHCPHCHKRFLVATQRLTEGEARFQCTSCQAFFAMNWQGLKDEGKSETYVLEVPQKTIECFKCHHLCDLHASECPACGILFEKFTSNETFGIRSHIVEISKAWEEVRRDYGNETGHQLFIKLCADHDQLIYATQQYKAILTVNPSESLAQKMQRLIIQMAEGKQLMGEASTKTYTPLRLKLDVYKLVVTFCLIFITVGLAFDPLRHFVALGSSVLFFALIIRHWIN